jgi:hypothetical protein
VSFLRKNKNKDSFNSLKNSLFLHTDFSNKVYLASHGIASKETHSYSGPQIDTKPIDIIKIKKTLNETIECCRFFLYKTDLREDKKQEWIKMLISLLKTASILCRGEKDY